MFSAFIKEASLSGAWEEDEWEDGDWGDETEDTEDTEDTGGEVTCPELNWPPFPAFKNNALNNKCWDGVQPSFRLYVAPGNGTVIQDTKTEGLTLQRKPEDSIKHLVVIIHGATNHAKVGEGESYWVHQMANLILEKDKVHQPGLAVLTVDWELGGDLWTRGSGGAASANTRYVGVATERVVKQLHQEEEEEEELYIHCIGYSLGAHACGFFGNAVTNDTDYPAKSLIDRITSLDATGPCFTKSGNIWNIFSAPEPIEAENLRDNERLDRTDALKVDALHTDDDFFGIAQSIGDADFYIGNKMETLGSEQSNCSHWNVDELMSMLNKAEFSISMSRLDPRNCWRQFSYAIKNQLGYLKTHGDHFLLLAGSLWHKR